MPVPVPSWSGLTGRRAFLRGGAVVACGYVLHVALDMHALSQTGPRRDLPYACGQFVLAGTLYVYCVLAARRLRDAGVPPLPCLVAYAAVFVACANVHPVALGSGILLAAHALAACVLAVLPSRRSGAPTPEVPAP